MIRLSFFLYIFLFLAQPIVCDIQPEPIKGKIFRPGNLENFESMLQRYDLILVDFYADWCGPCKQMHKVIEALAQDKDLDQVLFIEVNTEEQHALSARYHISTLPTIIIFLDGKPLNTLYGYKDKTSLKKILREALAHIY
jgi:thioredoxin